MSDFKAKMHQIQVRLWLHPDPAGGAYSVPPDLVTGFKGPASKERRTGREWEGGSKGEERRGDPKGCFTNSHPRIRNSKKYPDCRTDLIGGGGNKDVCPGWQTPSRLHWSLNLKYTVGTVFILMVCSQQTFRILCNTSNMLLLSACSLHTYQSPIVELTCF